MRVRMWVLFAGAMALGWVGTWVMRRVCFRLGILDVPNARSAHVMPTPTLGGVGLILSAWGALGFAALLGMPMPEFAAGLLGASAIFLILIYDEVRAMGRLSKLLVQLAAALLAMGGGVLMTRIAFAGAVFEFGALSFPMTLIGLVALQNLYNFMDGLDGFAGLEGVLVASLMAMLVWSYSDALVILSVAISGASLGFWIWNRPPARIFMGDVGAHFLALCFGALAIEGASAGVPFYVMLLPLGAFLFDAAYTIFRRLLRGENITLAHRFHLYQRLHRMGWSAWRINIAYAVCTLLLGATAFGILSGRFFAACATGSLSALMLIGGALMVERRWLKWTRNGI